MTVLFGWGPMFGTRGPSPFVMKCDIQLQMLGVSFERQVADLESVSKHKAPYVKDGDQIVQDSVFIRRHFEAKLGMDLDAGLTPTQRASAWAMERMLAEHLIPIMAMERWGVDANFEKGPASFFAGVPEAAREAVKAEVREQLLATMVAQGVGRHSREERMELAARDIAAAADFLGDQDFMFGDDPSAVDAMAFAALASCGTAFFDTPLVDMVAGQKNVSGYLTRMESRFFKGVEWPPMPGA